MLVVSRSPDHTRDIGEAVGHTLERGSVVGLIGELGAGKTVFAQGLARGLGVGPDEYVSSPTFALVNHYRGRVPVYHIDTYRLTDEAEMVSLGYEEYFDPDGVAIVEWADRVKGLLPEKRLLVELRITGPNTRDIEVTPLGPWPPPTVAHLADILVSLAPRVAR